MIVENRIRKRAVFLLVLALFAAVALAAHLGGGLDFVTESAMAPAELPPTRTERLTAQKGDGAVLGVPVATEAELAALGGYRHADYSSVLLFGGTPVPVDKESATIYLSQPITADTTCADLCGALELNFERGRLYFAPDPAFDHLAAAMAEGHGFRLLVADEKSGTYMEYKVVLTALPVLRLEGGFSHFDKDGESALTGRLSLLTADDPDEGGYTVKSSRASWHLRGATTSRQPKKSWKIDLIDEARANVDLAFLGLGSDDDWVLNSMSLDDTRMKEKLAMDTWNQLAAETVHRDNMSVGRYIEVVINGEYCGVYLMQRRIDENYLALAEDTVLLKGLNTWSATDPSDGYEIEYSPLSDRETYALIQDWSTRQDCSMADLDNFVDVCLFLQWGSMQDNTSYNNIYYVLQPNGDGYGMYMVPWDTDYAMGVLWVNDFFGYDMDTSVQMHAHRAEYEAMKQVAPDLDQKMAQRWFALRETVYSQEQILEKLNGYRRELETSGAFARDKAAWGEFYGGQDSFENLCLYFERRLAHLDAYYGKLLQ